MVIGRHQVHRRLDRTVEHLRNQDEVEHEQQDQNLTALKLKHHRAQHNQERYIQVNAHVPLSAERKGNARHRNPKWRKKLLALRHEHHL